MSQRKKVIPTLAELKADMKEMTFGQKVDHLWTYYKEYALLALVAVLMVVAVVAVVINKGKTPLIRGMMVNITISQKAYDYLVDDYFEKMGGQKGKDEVTMYYRTVQDMENATSGEDNYYSAQALITQVSAGVLDYALLDKLALEFYITQLVFMDLRQVFSEEQLAEMAEKDMLVYAIEVEGNEDLFEPDENSDLSGRFPIAIKMESLPFIQDNTSNTEIYFVVGGNNPNVEAVLSLWDHILAWES